LCYLNFFLSNWKSHNNRTWIFKARLLDMNEYNQSKPIHEWLNNSVGMWIQIWLDPQSKQLPGSWSEIYPQSVTWIQLPTIKLPSCLYMIEILIHIIRLLSTEGISKVNLIHSYIFCVKLPVGVNKNGDGNNDQYSI